MLAVQKYLHSHSFEELSTEFGIKLNYHPVYPMVILNYDQIESPKMELIVRECRGLVLNTNTFEIIAGCMERFFNIGEALEITKDFEWNDNVVMRTKEDGSIMTYFFNPFSNEWNVKTRGSWADMPIGENMPRWDELFFSLLPKDLSYKAQFCPELSYVFELCSTYNQVVRLYPEPKIFLLTIIGNSDNGEWNDIQITDSAYEKGIERPKKIHLDNEKEVREYIQKLEETDGTAEGLVLRDENNMRLKIKSSTYLAYSRLGGNGNITTDANLVPLIMANEQDEAIAIFPAIEPRVRQLQEVISNFFADLHSIAIQAKDIEEQKDFAIFITKTNYTPFNSILFNLKKDGKINDFQALKDKWNQSETLILKVLKG